MQSYSYISCSLLDVVIIFATGIEACMWGTKHLQHFQPSLSPWLVVRLALSLVFAVSVIAPLLDVTPCSGYTTHFFVSDTQPRILCNTLCVSCAYSEICIGLLARMLSDGFPPLPTFPQILPISVICWNGNAFCANQIVCAVAMSNGLLLTLQLF